MPVIETPKYFIVNVLRSNLFFLCVLRSESPPLLVVEFLHRIHDVFMDYFQSVDESTLKVSVVLGVESVVPSFLSGLIWLFRWGGMLG